MMMDERDRGPRLEWLVVPAAALAWVSATGFQLWDAGELSAAAWRLGGSHSPGQPLHALMGHLFARALMNAYLGEDGDPNATQEDLQATSQSVPAAPAR